MSFSKGEIVALKSGGPALTVVSVDGEAVTCLFFSDEIGEFKLTLIPAFALESYGDEEEEGEEEEEDEAPAEEEPSAPAKGRKRS